MSAFLKLRGDGPAFLLESAEQGRLGRWSFLGFRPRSILRWSDGSLSEWSSETAAPNRAPAPRPDRVTDAPDPYAAVAEYLGRYEIAEPDRAAARSRAAPSASSATTSSAPSSHCREPNPDPIGLPDMALMITDVLVAFDHQRHEVTLIANAFVEDGGIEEAYARAVRDDRRGARAPSGPGPDAQVARASGPNRHARRRSRGHAG